MIYISFRLVYTVSKEVIGLKMNFQTRSFAFGTAIPNFASKTAKHRRGRYDFMNELNIEVGARITELRKQRGYTREKLSELADVSVQFLADIEKGRKSMTVATLKRVAAALLVPTDYIVNGTTETGDNDGIVSILNTLSDKNKMQAEKILTVFAEAVND